MLFISKLKRLASLSTSNIPIYIPINIKKEYHFISKPNIFIIIGFILSLLTCNLIIL